MMSASHDSVRLHELRRLAYGELSKTAERALRARVAQDSRAAERLTKLLEDREAFERHAAAGPMSAAILARLDGSPPRSADGWGLWPAAGGATAVLTVALLIVGPWGSTSVDPGPTRTKGGLRPSISGAPPTGACVAGACPTLEMFVKDAQGIRAGLDGVTLRAGDWVQFRYRARGHRFLFIISVDDEGVLAPLYPDERSQSVSIQPDGRHVLEGSVILDDAVGPERFYAFFSSEPLAYEALAALLADISDPSSQAQVLGLPSGVDQVSVLINKESR